MKQTLRYMFITIFAVMLCPAYALNPDENELNQPEKIYSPFVERIQANANFAEGVYWGDTHLHTSYSTDAGMIGAIVTPEDAYRFAMGQEVRTNTGQRARLVRPLDFLVVADHAENLGLAPMIRESNSELLKSPWGKEMHDLVKAGKGYEAFQKWGAEAMVPAEDQIDNPKIMRTVWDRQIAAAEEYNDPGRFTALMGFEWTSINTAENPSNLHRVVIFKDDSDKVSQVLPFSLFDSIDPEDLWAYMAGYENQTGGSVLAIAHNGNLSNGLMFDTKLLNGKRMTEAYAKERARWEPLYEVTQIKGDGETHPFLSPQDEFADYGTWDKADIAGLKAKTNDMLPNEYARSALQIGLQLETELGTNPFKFGMIGSTDAHTGLASTREDNYWGKMASAEPSGDRYEHYVIAALSGDDALSTFEYETLASGLAAVWARENTREALFEAMQKKEVYATTGTRITVRLFGGWNYKDADVYSPEVISIGYDRGVPMGGEISNAPSGKAPVFMVGAMKDPTAANLDRIQIIKGWLDADGERHEQVYDVAVSDGRNIGEDGRSQESVGDTVDVANASYLNSIGDAELRAVWTDPDFDPTQPAAYYARVLEIPTPSWQAYDSSFFGIAMPEGVAMKGQERAYTSPIWYNPQ